MKIFRVAEEQLAPKWAFGNESLDNYQEKEAVNLERLNVTPPQEVSEETLATECKQIEHCASAGKIYHYNSAWNKSYIDHLKEYASICGLESSRFQGVNPQSVVQEQTEIIQEASNARNIKVAAVDTGKFKIDLGDPFHLEEKADVSHMEKSKWQEVKKQANMKEAPVMTSGIVPIRGGEDYFTNSNINANAKNQNSISDPDAIKNMVESVTEDTGARLKRQLQEKEAGKKASHAVWQKDVVDSMEHNEIVPKGKVFPTESMNAQSGLNSPSSKMGVYAKFDPASIPEKTKGEQIAEKNVENKKSIQREEKGKTEFQASRQASRQISDVFSEQLKKYVK